jgi:bla regulator protein BlaR1
MDMIETMAGLILARLAWTALQAALFVGAVSLAIRLLPALSAAARCTLWWLVALQVLVGFAWSAPIRLPLLAPPPAVASETMSVGPDPAPTTAYSPTPDAAPAAPLPWRTLLVAVWMLGLLAQTPLLARQARQARLLRKGSTALTDRAMQARCREAAAAIGLRRCPELRSSAALTSPQVTGWWRPVILWPACSTLSSAESSMALAHELAHLRRGDLWLGWLPALAQRLFFFPPLVAKAAREYAFQREAACDARVLQQDDAMPQAYGQLLLRLGVGHPAQASLGSASESFVHLKRRLSMLGDAGRLPRHPLRNGLLIGMVALVGVLPYRVTASHVDSARATNHSRSVTSTDGHVTNHSDTDIYTDENFHANAYALFHQAPGHETVTISGNTADIAAAKKLHETHDNMFWFRRGDAAYLVLDEGTIERIRTAYEPATQFQRDNGVATGKDAALRGELEGLNGWERSIDEQRRGLLDGDHDIPAYAQRLADLDAQRITIGERRADLARQREALVPEQRRRAQQWQDIRRRAEAQATQVIDEALAKGIARPVTDR